MTVRRNIETSNRKEHGLFELEQQAGFRAGASCIDQVFTSCQLNKKKVATNKQVNLFVDLTKAYDNISPFKSLQVLENINKHNLNYINSKILL